MYIWRQELEHIFKCGWLHHTDSIPYYKILGIQLGGWRSEVEHGMSWIHMSAAFDWYSCTVCLFELIHRTWNNEWIVFCEDFQTSIYLGLYRLNTTINPGYFAVLTLSEHAILFTIAVCTDWPLCFHWGHPEGLVIVWPAWTALANRVGFWWELLSFWIPFPKDSSKPN